MRVLLQRTRWAAVKAADQSKVEIGPGMMGLVGFASEDEQLPGTRAWNVIVDKILHLRIFPDDRGLMNLSLVDVDGELLLVPQFTLYADCRRGRRPGFSGSAPADAAGRLFDMFAEKVLKSWSRVSFGYFGAEMEVELCNWGPVTIMLDSSDYLQK